MFSGLAELISESNDSKSVSFQMKKALKVCVFIIWLSVLVGAYSFAVMYSATPGKAQESPPLWPGNSKLELDRERMTMVMLVHPRCTCSRASLNELTKILNHCPGMFKTYVLVVVPEGINESWAKTDLFETARSIKDVQVVFDHGGEISKSFGALTSGHTFVYLKSGKLAFTGGITASRAHEGDNFGQSAIENLVKVRDGMSSSQVFGCPL